MINIKFYNFWNLLYLNYYILGRWRIVYIFEVANRYKGSIANIYKGIKVVRRYLLFFL